MEIPPNALEKLKCSRCENYLSRGPIYVEHDEATICGQCFSPKRPAIRIKCYETTAKLLGFPCKNRDLGCLEKVPFADESEVIGHEEVCSFRQYVCPILGSARCEWVGSRTELQKHCEDKHPERVKVSPITLTHDISKSSESNYLLLAFKMLFLLHTKVCVTSGKIYHAVRFFGQSNNATDFTFKTDIKRNNAMLSKSGDVLDQGPLVIKEDLSQVLDVNSLLNFLDGYEGTTFTITIEKSANAVNLCFKCKAVVTAFTYRTEDGWWCLSCAPAKENCKNMSYGCTYKDIPKQISKHSCFFCEYANYCYVCSTKFNRTSLLPHYNAAHQNVTYSAGSTWQIKWTENDQRVLLTCAAGTAVCSYFINNNKLILELDIPVTSDKLHEFNCKVRLSQISSDTVHTYKPETNYNSWYDWLIEIPEANFPNTSREFNICVDITKTFP